ncbi:MAG: glutamine-hydrolyzing carbamoyl-phosphate synthase small subunit [Lachnospiraceae bacterium]|nr:glutamine-hydrolyzing carbamoyl-phosphate synthase small subunit [Lachnospiraceae bacterium]
MEYNRKLILEDGQEYCGYGFGSNDNRVCELVFNTSMVGYQEILSDPSYTYQAIVMSYPLIGNYGMAEEDYESENLTAGALIVHEYNDLPSNFRSTATLSSIMEKYDIPGIYGIDTRKLVRSIRDFGSRKVLITDAGTTKEEGIDILKKTEIPKDAVSKVSCQHIWKSKVLLGDGLAKAYKTHKKHIVAIDCGMKKNIVLSLNRLGLDVTIVPWNTSADEIRNLRPDGVFISNGPGDPEDADVTIATVKELIGEYPIFGICLGHQIISLAYGAKTYKLKFGHRGGNHPVKNLETGKIEITSQNHSYAVDPESIKDTPLKVTHLNILDKTIEGVSCENDRIYSVQYHPESAPGPQDSRYLFDKFLKMIEG